MATLTESSKKFYDYIVKEIKKLKPGQELQLSTAEINKAIDTNVTTSTASAIIKRNDQWCATLLWSGNERCYRRVKKFYKSTV